MSAVTLPHPDWTIEEDDPSVGIFGGPEVYHETCPLENTPAADLIYGGGTYQGEGQAREVMMIRYAVCDCGAVARLVETTWSPE